MANKFKCPKKIKKECNATGQDCDHAVIHKKKSFCDNGTEECPSCVEIDKINP